jgi:hypothetical protein
LGLFLNSLLYFDFCCLLLPFSRLTRPDHGTVDQMDWTI